MLFRKHNEKRLDYPDLFFFGPEPNHSPIYWIGSKVELCELLVALDRQGSLGDKSGHHFPFTEALAQITSFLNISLTDASTVKKNVLDRKSKRTAFIDALRLSLLTERF